MDAQSASRGALKPKWPPIFEKRLLERHRYEFVCVAEALDLGELMNEVNIGYKKKVAQYCFSEVF
jgi:hypothetical protein